MKKSTFFIMTLLTGIILCHFSCRKKSIADDGGTVVQISVDELTGGETIDTVVNVLAKRLSRLYPDNNTVVVYDNGRRLIRAELPQINFPKSNSYVFTALGNMQIMETADPMDFMSKIKYADFSEGQKDTLRMMTIVNQYDLGVVSLNDTAAVNRFFSSDAVRELLPRNYSFSLAWGIPFINNHGDSRVKFVVLYCLKKSKRNIQLNEAWDSSVVEPSPVGDKYNLALWMTSRYAAKFQALTKENIGRTLAITLDDVVLSIPIVNDEIHGGALVISGGFSKEEVSVYDAFLSVNPISSKLSVHSIEYVK